MLLSSIKTQLNLFLAAFAFFLALKEKDLSLLSGILLTGISCGLIEGLFLFLKNRKFQITASSITSGLILGLVLSSKSPWWMLFIASSFTISLKHLVHFRGKNLLNPAAAGIFLAVLLLKSYTAWKGAYLWYILVPAGLYFVHKIRKTELILGYAGVSLLLFGSQALAQQTPLGNIFGYLNYFFIFIMLIEPKTTPALRWPKVLFGAGVAGFIFLLTEWGFRYEPELFALLTFNLLTPSINKLGNLKFPTFKKE